MMQSVFLNGKHVQRTEITMPFCSFASLFGGACGASSENPNAAEFVDLKDCTRDVTAHLKGCKILTDVESVNNERKLLLTRAGQYKSLFLPFSVAVRLCYI